MRRPANAGLATLFLMESSHYREQWDLRLSNEVLAIVLKASCLLSSHVIVWLVCIRAPARSMQSMKALTYN